MTVEKETLLTAMILDAVIALGYLAYSAVLVVLACTALSGWKALLALVAGLALFLYASIHGGLYSSVLGGGRTTCVEEGKP